MNYLLQLNKSLVLIFLIFLTIISLIFFFVKDEIFSKSEIKFDTISDNSFDILNPKFTINNANEIITIQAEKGNFLNKNNIVLENNVVFKSDKFKIYSSKVLFDKKNQTAYSKKNSTFISEGTTIESKGFEITDKGNTIQFNGKTKIMLLK
ncbi:MAG: LPS export ABC transporter periplasmic protein LptC [Alphaproteobacteria bacterium]|nr:LPS export ABC transporter periplasmic protein LptC [Alphaproteobacteria bacterium]